MSESLAAAPAEADRQPRRDRPRFYCPNCGAFAQQLWHDLLYRDSPGFTFLAADTVLPNGVVVREPISRWRVAQCASCAEWSVWHRETMVYPARRLGGPAHGDMPADVRSLYVEAAAVAAVSRRAGAALARATVERLIKHLDPDAPPNTNLEQRIERLLPRVSEPLQNMLDVVRVAGNKSLHIEDEPCELVVLVLNDETGPALVEWLLQTANDLVAELITRPKAARAMRETIPEGIRARLDRMRDGAAQGGDDV